MAQELDKGQNGPITASRIRVGARSTPPVDLSALLVTGAGRVRSDADFVFYNQPRGAGVELVGGPAPAVEVDLTALPAEIEQVRIVLTPQGQGQPFAQGRPPVTVVADAAGQELYSFAATGLERETILIAVELYRREGDWKVRAVGQGYEGGFAELVRDHGVSVDDAPAPPAPPAPPRQAGSGEVSLTKNRPVSLVKGQRVSLRKDGGVPLTQIRMGLGWDAVQKRGFFGSRQIDIDLDASVVILSGGQVVDGVYYGQLTSRDGSIRHSGDNLTGEGEGDDEMLSVDLTRVPPYVDTLIFIVTSYQGHTFTSVVNAFCRLVDLTTGAELARFSLSGGSPTTAMSMARVFRSGDGWKLEATGTPFNAKHIGEAVGQLPLLLG